MRVAFSIGCVLAVLATTTACSELTKNRPGRNAGAATTADAPPLIDLESGEYRTVTLFQEVEASKLAASEQYLQVIPLKVGPTDSTFVYRVKVRSLAVADGSLRLRAVWLPEGGWKAMDADGKQVAQVDVKLIPTVEHDGGSFSLQMIRPAEAIELRVFLVNDGSVELEVGEVEVLEAVKIVGEPEAGKSPTACASLGASSSVGGASTGIAS